MIQKAFIPIFASIIVITILLMSTYPKMIESQKHPEIEILNFATDKNTYSSYEDMKISLLIKSSKDLENVTIRVWGIKPRNYAYINDSKIVNLKEGENEITFTEKTPYCTSGCGGVYPGPYDLNAEVWINGKSVANSTKTINLVKS
ncbi:MAG: hypothetical protein QXY24_01455 [Candidatus Aenigmatarchaeota archaeon]